jgi:hypothetical protein
MGASDSKLSFKQGIFRLSEPKQIPADDAYWTGVCASLLLPWLSCTIILMAAPVLGAA